MKSMATEWAAHKIRVNALCPGYQFTQLLKDLLVKEGNLTGDWVRDTPMGRMGDPKELRGPIVFMASEASSFMTGHELVSCYPDAEWGGSSGSLLADGVFVWGVGCRWGVYGVVGSYIYRYTG